MLLLCGVANAADVTLSVNAKDNCFDLQKKSMVTAASTHLDNGSYVVSISSNNAKYHGGSLPVDKVGIYITTDNNPKGWFYTINAGESTVLDVTGQGAEANTVYGYYTDIICGDNNGGSVVAFNKIGDRCSPQIANNAAAASVCGPVCDQAGLVFAGNWSNDRNHPPVKACIDKGAGQAVCGCAAKK